MRKIFITILLITVVLTACNENFEPQIYGSLSPVNFPSTEAEYELYMMEAYKPFQAKWGWGEPDPVGWQNNFFSYEYGHVLMFDASTDIFTNFTEWGGHFEGFSSGDFSFYLNQGRANSHFEKVRFVTRLTKIVDDIENSDISESAKTDFIAQTRLSRGWIMYYLLHMYGPVPVILDPALIGTDAEADLTRPERSVFVNSIEADLLYAAEHLDTNPSEYGRFNKGLARFLLMKHYLDEGMNEEAESIGQDILGMGYELVDDYASLFREETEVNSETIYAVTCENGQSGDEPQGNMNAFAFYCYPVDYPGNVVKTTWPSPNGVYMATWDFYDSFDDSDERKDLLVESYMNDNNQERNRTNMRGALIAKYPDEGGIENSFQGNDIVIARYADVLLMMAEAINEQRGPADAVDLVDEVRNRAGLDDLEGAARTDQAALKDAILEERAKELYMEGWRKFDLERHGKWQSSLTAAGKDPGPVLFPIPTYAINNSDGQLGQNQGY